jgi:hypothetical protein
MKITLTPESAEDEQWIRDRAEQDKPTKRSHANAVTDAAKDWVEEHPPLPGPGSIVRWTQAAPSSKGTPWELRYVDNKGNLRHFGSAPNDEGTPACRAGRWTVGGVYELVYEHGTDR